MTIDDITRLIAKDENRHLELKKTTGELKDAMHTACAFLNGEGGWLVFGVAPKSLRILGQEVNDNTQREIAQALSGLEPAVNISIEYLDIPDRNGCQVIAMYFEAFAWGHQPYTYHGCPYYKVESTTKMMPREMFEDRLRAHKPNFYSWERMKADGIVVDDLDEQLIRGSLRLGVEKGRVMTSALTAPLTDVLDKLDLLSDGKPNNAAVALFSTKLRSYTQMQIRMARFRGTDKHEFIDNQRVSGNFFQLLDAGMSFFLKHLNMSGKIVGFRREENLEVPAEALREALTNALCHRQFEKFNLTPSIAIYDDRIEIENPGLLPPQITVDTITQSHSSYPYNPVMAEVLYKTTFLESWGSGADRILEACRANHVEDPKWCIDGGFICITFVRPVTDPMKQPVGLQRKVNSWQNCNGSSVFTPQVPPKFDASAPQVPPKFKAFTPQVHSLICVLGEEFLPVSVIMEKMELKDRKNFRLVYLLPALKDGVIERKYPDSPNHPRQQYRLTEQARKWKQDNIG